MGIDSNLLFSGGEVQPVSVARAIVLQGDYTTRRVTVSSTGALRIIPIVSIVPLIENRKSPDHLQEVDPDTTHCHDMSAIREPGAAI